MTRRDFQYGALHVLADRHADGVRQRPGPSREPVKELVRAAAGVRPDQDPAAQVPGSCASASRAASAWSPASLPPKVAAPTSRTGSPGFPVGYRLLTPRLGRAAGGELGYVGTVRPVQVQHGDDLSFSSRT